MKQLLHVCGEISVQTAERPEHAPDLQSQPIKLRELFQEQRVQHPVRRRRGVKEVTPVTAPTIRNQLPPIRIGLSLLLVAQVGFPFNHFVVEKLVESLSDQIPWAHPEVPENAGQLVDHLILFFWKKE